MYNKLQEENVNLNVNGFGEYESLEENSNILSKITFLWCDKFIHYCFKNVLKLQDIYKLATYDKSNFLDEIFEINWRNEYYKNGKSTSSFNKALFKSFGNYFIIGLIFFGISTISQFIGPVLLQKIIEFIIKFRNNENDSNWGYYYSIIMFINAMIGSIFLYQSNMITSRTGNRIKSIIILKVYKKSLKLNNKSRSKKSDGEIVNLMSNDAQRMLELFQIINPLIFGIPIILVSMILLYKCLGWPSLIAPLIMSLSTPFSSKMGHKLLILRKELIKCTDKRIKIINEVLQAIKAIKFYCWQDSFSNKVELSRLQEIKILSSLIRFRYILIAFINSLPILVFILMFSVYYLVNKSLPADKIFASVAYLNILRVPFSFMPLSYNIYIQYKISIERIVEFLNLNQVFEDDEQDGINDEDDEQEININVKPVQIESQNEIGIYINNSTFSWDDDDNGGGEQFTLKNINIELNKKGSLLMIIGPVGSGKSSLCQAILGEMNMVLNPSSSLRVVGSIAYVSQTSWIMNATLKDNILFGNEFNKEKYEMVLESCALKLDIESFPQGDQVEIGERGINLSGGQKSRVSLARAIYSNSDIYILDDILSAVDNHVAKHIFNNCIKGILKDKIIVLATNQLNYCPFSTSILILKQLNGEIEYYDSFNNIIEKINNNNNNSSDFSKLLNESINFKLNEESSHKEHDKDKEQDNNKLIDGKLTSIEEIEEGSVSFKHYLNYFKIGGKYLFLIAFIGFFLDTSATIFQTWWLSNWSSNYYDKQGTSSSTSFLIIFSIIGIIAIILLIFRNIIFFEYSIKAAKEIHKKLFESIINAPMYFFDSVPIGRILNRFTRDIDIVDLLLANSIQYFLNLSTMVIGILILIIIITPWLLIPLIPIIILFYFIQYFYRSTSIQIQRLESISRSPIFSHFIQSLNGVQTIRAFKKSNENILINQFLLDNNNKCYLTLQAMNQWLGLRLSILGNLITLFACLFIVFDKSKISIANVGLSISYTLSLTSIYLNKAIIQLAEMETKMNSIERINYYTTNIPSEEEDKSSLIISTPQHQDDIGNNIKIKFENVNLKYRNEFPLVLKGISFEIKENEKIGICGRTGSGKSSLFLALFRIVELTSGKIIIDGYDISKISLKQLRSEMISIIPQDPIMFNGTLRSNLDPTSKYQDYELIEILKEIQLFNYFNNNNNSSNNILDSIILENGSNLSVGQRQLLCLGRVILIKPKILVCDEASSSVDSLTDTILQRIIRDKFKNSIILTIAHRINTILDSDRIMVLSNGIITEFDKPSNLLKNENSFLNYLINSNNNK